MVYLNSLVILCLVQFTLSEDRISVDTVSTITATAGYSIADNNHSPTVTSLSSNLDFTSDHDSSKDSSSSSEAYTPASGLRNSQSLALRTRQARGKPNQWQHSGSVEDKDVEIATFPLNDHRLNDQLYSVKPQTFDGSSSQFTDVKSNESGEKLVPAITYGKKMQLNDSDDDRPAIFNNWSEEVHAKLDNNKPVRSRKKNAGQEKRKPQINKIMSGGDNKDGWQEVSPNMEIATGFSTTVQEHDSSQETSGSSESFKTHPIVYHSESSISSVENGAQVEPQNFNHKQVLSKMNHFDFSNAVSQPTKTPPPREKRLNYQPGGSGGGGNGLSPIRYTYGGGMGGGQSLKASVPPSTVIKPVKVEQPNYHSIVVPIPITHHMYAAISGDSTLAGSTTQQAMMMSLPVVHNVFFKTDENGGGKTMPAIVIPLKPEYLHHLQQQQQYVHHPSDAGTDTQNTVGHLQRPVLHGSSAAGGSGSKALQYQQQQLQSSSSLTPSTVYQQKPKPSKVKKPFNTIKDDQHRVKQPFNLQQHQFYNNPFAGGGHQQQQQQQQQHGLYLHPGHYVHQPQHDSSDDSRFAQTAGAPAAVPAAVHPFSTAGHSLIVKRPHAYGYPAPVTPPKFAAANKSPQQQLQLSSEDLTQQQPYRATTYHPGFAYLNGPDDDFPYRPVYKDGAKKRNDVLVVRTERRK